MGELPASPPAHLTILDELASSGVRLGLEPLRRLLADLGNPQLAVPSVLVAGTNGKGSTAALLQSIAVAGGYRTGFYSSPHLEDPVERIRIDGQAIGGEELADRLRQVLAAATHRGHPTPTYFEAMTAVAFSAFAARKLDLMVLEVGMGGRLDATNLAEPLLSLITSISRDHAEFLGSTIPRITREKAGILRPSQPAIAAPGDPRAARTLTRLARRSNTPLSLIGADTVTAEPLAAGSQASGAGAQTLSVATPTSRYDGLVLALAGKHQHANLALAVHAAEALRSSGFERLDATAIRRGVARCRWPGRLEQVALPDGRWVVFDAAHNEDGARVLVAALGELEARLGKAALLFGVLADKDAGAMLPALARGRAAVVLTRPSSPRAREPVELNELLVSTSDAPTAQLIAEPRQALARALELAGSLVVVAGSIVLVGELRQVLRQRYGVPPAAATILLA